MAAGAKAVITIPLSSFNALHFRSKNITITTDTVSVYTTQIGLRYYFMRCIAMLYYQPNFCKGQQLCFICIRKMAATDAKISNFKGLATLTFDL